MATKYKDGLRLAVKFGVLFAAVLAALIYSDRRGYFQPDQSNNHTSRKWNSFYTFTKKNNVDVVLVGNSHMYAGCNPKNLSAALGCNCFVLASPGTTLADSYYCLKEAFTRTSPKIAVIETYTIGNTQNRKITGGGLSDQYKSFNARKNFKQKILSSFMLFSVDNIPPAWSTTLRNHEFVFRDRAQLKRNIEDSKKPKKPDNRLYLGRFVAFNTGIENDIMQKYDSLGAPLDGASRTISNETRRYIGKIVSLCRKHNVVPVFLTIPVYYKHVANYEVWHRTVNNALKDYNVYWADFQHGYDTAVFNRDCFESTYEANQHMTYTGSIRTAYMLANYIKDSVDAHLPERNKDEKWHAVFYGEEGYFENYPARKDDAKHLPVRINLQNGSLPVKDAVFCVEQDYNTLFVKIPKREGQAEPGASITVQLNGLYNNSPVSVPVDLDRSKNYNPPAHYLYTADLVKEFVPDEIIKTSPRK